MWGGSGGGRLSRIIGILLMALCVWIGVEFYTKGTDGAFGGFFAGALDPVASYEADPGGRSPTQKVEDRVRADIRRGFERTASKVVD